MNSGIYPFKQIKKWIFRLNTFIHPSSDNFHFHNNVHYLGIPFSIHNGNILYRVSNLCKKRFNCNIISSFSTYSSLKQILCKSKILFVLLFIIVLS